LLHAFLPNIPINEIKNLYEKKEYQQLFELIVAPLHEELFKRQDFSFVKEISPGQELILCFDYVRMQVLQGGYIQLIQNGYVSLLVPIPEMLNQIHCDEMSKNIDDALKVYTLNHETLDKETSVDEFAKLYEEFKEFEYLDQQFQLLYDETIQKIADYIIKYPDEFIAI
jgi:hypothetical protein